VYTTTPREQQQKKNKNNNKTTKQNKTNLPNQTTPSGAGSTQISNKSESVNLRLPPCGPGICKCV
jgi:hypothetical protein